MDAKITKSRLGLLLSYDWIKIIGICVAAVLVWTLLFTTLATRATSGQIFEIYAYAGVRANFNQLGTLDGLQPEGRPLAGRAGIYLHLPHLRLRRHRFAGAHFGGSGRRHLCPPIRRTKRTRRATSRATRG